MNENFLQYSVVFMSKFKGSEGELDVTVIKHLYYIEEP